MRPLSPHRLCLRPLGIRCPCAGCVDERAGFVLLAVLCAVAGVVGSAAVISVQWWVS